MKKVLFFIFIGLLMQISFAQQPQEVDKQNFKDVVQAYMDYFQEYDPLAPESVRKAKFNEIVNKENPNLSLSDREKAYTIVDAYIRADKGLETTIEISDDDQKFIENLLTDAENQKQAGMQAMISEVNRYKNMSYAEYKASVTQNGQIPLPESEVQKAFNVMHKEDGKQVQVTTDSPKMDIVQAIDIINKPATHTFSEFRAAMLFINKDIPDDEIKKAWAKKHNN